MRARGPGLGDHPGEQRGRVLRHRRQNAPRTSRGSRHGRVGVHSCRRHADHALRIPDSPLAAPETAHRGHQVQCPTARYGHVGRNRRRSRRRVPRCHLGQDAGGRHDGAHDAEPAEPGYHGRHQPACRHPLRPCRRTGRQPRGRAHRQHRPGAPLPVDVRTDSRLGVRHHRQGHRQPGGKLLDRG